MLLLGEEYTVRFKVPNGKIVSIDDAVRGTVTWNAEECLGDFIILRSSGMPVYNFCVAVGQYNPTPYTLTLTLTTSNFVLSSRLLTALVL
jgi:hypothetical protein